MTGTVLPMEDSGERVLGLRAHRAFFGAVSLLPGPLRRLTRQVLFEGRHARSRDPWGVEVSEYELAKRARLIEAVRGCSPGVVLEVGCSVGANVAAIAEVLPQARVVGVDVSRRAVRLAQERVSGLPWASVRRVRSLADLRGGAVVGGVDVLVLSEVLYYMGGPRGIERELSAVAPLLGALSEVILVHSGADAERLHEAAARALGVVEVANVREGSASGGFLLTRAVRGSRAIAQLPVPEVA